jgi:hypothetical protein
MSKAHRPWPSDIHTTICAKCGRRYVYVAASKFRADHFRHVPGSKPSALAERARHEIEEDARAEALAEVREDDRRAAWLDDEREPVEPMEAWR